MEEGLLSSLVIALISAAVISAAMHRIRQSLLIGYLLTGILIGPSVTGLVRNQHDIQAMAEIGVIMLMFTLGVEFSVTQLRRLRRPALLGGSIQLWGTMGVVMIATWFVERNLTLGVFLGCIFAMSSTVIVMKLMQEAGGFHTPHGTAALGISIHQDMMLIPLLLLLTALGKGQQGDFWGNIGSSLGKSLLFLGASWMANKVVTGWFFDVVAQTRSKELFTISSVALCLGITLLARALGLSVALGAFVAGLLVSSSIYSHKILADALPFRDCFLSLFFIAMGMLVNIQWIAENWTTVFGWGIALISLKFLICMTACLICGCSLRSAILASYCLSQVGEFSFVILMEGVDKGTVSKHDYQLFLSVILFTLAVIPAFWRPLERWVNHLSRHSFFRKLESMWHAKKNRTPMEPFKDHLILLGCGPFGRVVLRSADQQKIRAVVLDLNPKTVRSLHKAGYDAIYGEASNLKILDSLHIETACAMVVTIPDIQAAVGIIRETRSLRPHLPILARARFESEVDRLRHAGANHVVYEEMEAAKEMARVLVRRIADIKEKMSASTIS